MTIEMREINSFTREVRVSVPWTELEAGFDRTLRQFQKKAQFPGFRRGNVPRPILLQHFAKDVQAQFVEESVEEHYVRAVGEKRLVPVNRASIDRVEFEHGKDLSFRATVEVEPEVRLPGYRKGELRVTQPVYEPDEGDVDLYLRDMQNNFSEIRPVDGSSAVGHLLGVDLQELDGAGNPIIGRKAENRFIKVGEGMFGGDNLSLLSGLRPGDQTRLELPTQSGGRVGFGVTVRSVQEEIVPDINEDLFRRAGEGEISVAEFRARVMERILRRLTLESAAELERAIIGFFVQETRLEAPSSMVDGTVEEMMEGAKGANGRPIDQEAIRGRLRSVAENNVKWFLIRKSLLAAEGVEVSEESVEEKVKELVARGGSTSEDVRRFYKKPSNREKLHASLEDERLFDLLKRVARVTEKRVRTSDLRQRGESSAEK